MTKRNNLRGPSILLTAILNSWQPWITGLALILHRGCGLELACPGLLQRCVGRQKDASGERSEQGHTVRGVCD